MKAYPEYKPSDIDWLGEIPSHWNRMPLKAVLSKSSAGTWGEEANEDDSDVVCYRVADFDYPHLQLSDKNLTYRSIDERQFLGREVNKGDIVIEKSGGGDLWPVGRAVISKFDFKATCSNFMHVISSNEKANNFFINYLLATIYMHGINRQFFAQTTGIQNLNIREYLSQYVYFPPIAEQEVIAAYLDDMTGKVDALIAEKQKQVEDLRAYRTSLITETVTRGLNPKCDFVALQNEWLPKIPCGWYLKKFKYAAIVKANLVHPEEYLQYPQVSPDCIEKNTGRLLGYKTVEDAGIISDNHLFFKGQLVYSKIRPNLNKVIIAPFDGLCSADMYPIETPNDTSFFKYLMLSTFFVNQVSRVIQERVKMPKINQEELGEILVVVPPIAEQQAIAEFLDEKTEKIDTLIDELSKQLDELAEYKKAVISEAVTGKVDVRDWTPKS